MNFQEVASASAMIKNELTPAFEKIGKGVEWGYGLFIKQAYVNAFTELLWIIPGILLIYFSKYFFKQGTILKNDNQFSNWEMSYATAAGAGVLGLILILLPISSVIQVLINPDFAAIQLIIETFKTTTSK